MDWTRLETKGRVTALRRGVCAGVTADGLAFVVRLGPAEPAVATFDGLLVDSFGVLGASSNGEVWVTGRGADGHLHLWATYADGGLFLPHSLEATGAMWAAPALDDHAALVLASHLRDGAWRLAAYARESAVLGGSAEAGELVLGAAPDSSLSFSFYEKSPLVVAGTVGQAADPVASAWALTPTDGQARPEDDWRRIHLSPAPTVLSSVVAGSAGGRTWIAGRVETLPVVYELLPLPFRGLLRTSTVAIPRLELAEEAVAQGARSVVLVDDAPGNQPMFVAASARGNRLCWSEPGEWKAFPVPEGKVESASWAGGRVHVLVDEVLWSLPAPGSA
jgi:hypothetical protein